MQVGHSPCVRAVDNPAHGALFKHERLNMIPSDAPLREDNNTVHQLDVHNRCGHIVKEEYGAFCLQKKFYLFIHFEVKNWNRCIPESVKPTSVWNSEEFRGWCRRSPRYGLIANFPRAEAGGPSSSFRSSARLCWSAQVRQILKLDCVVPMISTLDERDDRATTTTHLCLAD